MDSYKILSQGDCITLDGVDDAEELRTVKAAFDTIGMEEEAQMQVRASYCTDIIVVLSASQSKRGVVRLADRRALVGRRRAHYVV